MDHELNNLIAQRDMLDAKINTIKLKQKTDAVEKCRELIVEFDLTPNLLFKTDRRKQPVAPKYRDPETGKTWSGRGRAPKWMEGQDPAIFLI